MILLNARISPKSYARWKLIKNYYNELLQTFSIIFAQSINDQQRLQKLSDKNIQRLKIYNDSVTIQLNKESILKFSLESDDLRTNCDEIIARVNNLN